MAQATTRGRFLWHELMTSDPKAALSYDYRFSTPEERRRTGAWWVRHRGPAR